MSGKNGKAVVLLSGGIDSSTTLAMAMDRGFDAYAMSFRYGQRHAAELDAAKKVAVAAGVSDHIIVPVELDRFGGSALTEPAIAVPKSGVNPAEIPVTYVPARNTVFLSLALAWGETLGIGDIFIGVNAVDYSGYPDCRPEYITAFQAMANLATRGGVTGTTPVTIHTPLIDLSKADIIRAGVALGVDYSLTLSCYDPSPTGLACGRCDSCRIRRDGFRQAGVPDPTRYA